MKKILGLLGSVWGGVITHKLRSFPDDAGDCCRVPRSSILMAVGKGSTNQLFPGFPAWGQIHLL